MKQEEEKENTNCIWCGTEGYKGKCNNTRERDLCNIYNGVQARLEKDDPTWNHLII
jgi:hypothetical protein